MVSEIKIGGVTYPLRFGVASASEMSMRTAENISGNDFKLTQDLIYAGRMNHAIANDLPIPSYSEAYEITEDLYEDEEGQEKQTKMWAEFEESKAGRSWLEKIAESKKKIQEILQTVEQTKTGQVLESTASDF